MDLPDLAGYFGGVTVPFGCNGAGPLVATTPPGEVPSPDAGRDALSAALTGTTAWNYHEEGWQAVETQALDGATAAGQIISGPRGAVIRAAEMTESSGPNRPIAIAAWPSGRATEIETTGDDTFLWRGNKDQMIWVYDTEISSALTVIEVEP